MKLPSLVNPFCRLTATFTTSFTATTSSTVLGQLLVAHFTIIRTIIRLSLSSSGISLLASHNSSPFHLRQEQRLPGTSSDSKKWQLLCEAIRSVSMSCHIVNLRRFRSYAEISHRSGAVWDLPGHRRRRRWWRRRLRRRPRAAPATTAVTQAGPIAAHRLPHLRPTKKLIDYKQSGYFIMYFI